MNLTNKHDIKKEHIVFLGESTFPDGLAAVQRMTMMAKALIIGDYEVTVICRKGGSRANRNLKFSAEGNFEGINYVYTSGNIFRPDGFLKRNILKIKGMIGEFKYLYRLKKEQNISAAIISNHSSFHLFRYRIYSLLIGFPIVLNFVELASSMKGREKIFTKINDYVFDHFIIKIVDGALPISNKLMDNYRTHAPSKPSLKLPILCDFEKFNLNSNTPAKVIMMYSGAASYLELIEFILTGFDQLEIQEEVFLHLILGGNDAELNRVRKRLAVARNRKNIRLTTNVPHKDIPEYYATACALLIPLRPTVQDEARFPHKIGEYLASGKPMITTAFGEINNYGFIDKKNCLIADDYDIDAFADKMKFIVENRKLSEKIGIEGKQFGLKNFDYSGYGKTLREYFTLVNP
ncbi:glycosyltransferase [Bacteroidota bacterium]